MRSLLANDALKAECFGNLLVIVCGIVVIAWACDCMWRMAVDLRNERDAKREREARD